MGVKFSAKTLRDALEVQLGQMFPGGSEVKVRVTLEPKIGEYGELTFSVNGSIEVEGVIRLPQNRSQR